MSVMARNRAIASPASAGFRIGIGSIAISKTYQPNRAGRPLPGVTVRAAAGPRSRGWLTAGGQTIKVALGSGGIRSDKREGDGGTPKGTFRPRRLWWRADRHPRPRTF